MYLISKGYRNFGSVFYTETEGFKYISNVLNKTHSIAYGTYNDTMNETGWGILEIKAGYYTDANYGHASYERNQLIMQAAGYLEAYLTLE